ncbi:MAG: hypothetical protein JWM76_5130 [Pseudonocardiales bacterium]|nr:hypothetical protein [Pseudonocardiales bacterium]
MKVLRVYHGGRDGSHRERDRALVRLGVDLSLLVPDRWPGAETLTDDSFEIISSAVLRPGDVNRHRYVDVADFTNKVAVWRPDVIDLHEEPFSTVTHQLLQSLTLQYPVVGYTAQNLDKRFPPPFAQRERHALSRFDGMYPCTSQAASVVVGKGFSGALSILPLAPAEAFSAGDQRLDGREVRLLVAGRMLPRKGILDAVRVLGAVRSAGYQASLDLVGEGPELLEARRLAEALGVADGLNSMPWLSADALAERYRRAHVVLAPSMATRTWVEQFGRMVVEAQASGAVVVAYDSGSLPEVVGAHGVIVPAGDIASMSAAVVSLLGSPGRWSTLRASGLATTLNWDDVAAGQLDLYEQAIALRMAKPLVYRSGSRPSRAAAQSRFGAPAVVTGDGRPFALPGLREDNPVTRTLARVIDHFAHPEPGATPPTPTGENRFEATAPRRIKVVYLDHVARWSGAEISLVRMIGALEGVDAHVILGEDGPLVAALQAVGATVEVMALNPATRDLRRADTVRVRAILRSIGAVSTYSWRLSRRLRELTPDLVHTNSLKAGFYGTMAAKLARLPVIWHVRDRIANDYLPPAAVLATRILINYAPDLVLANSAETLRAATQLGRQANRGRVTLSVIAGVISDVAPAVIVRTQGEGQTVGMVGRLAEWKGQEVFLRAFARAFEFEDSMKARIVGAAVFGETDYVHKLNRLIADLQLSQRVVLTGHVEDVPAEMRGLDILVHASTVPEPFGLVVIEGMAAGLAVIASDGGGPREIITDGVNGLLTPMGDVEALSKALLRLHHDAKLRQQLGEGAQLRAADYSSDVIGPRLSGIYHELIDRRTPINTRAGGRS